MLAVAVVEGVVVCRMAHQWLALYTLGGDNSNARLTWVFIGLGCFSAANLMAQVIPFFDFCYNFVGRHIGPIVFGGRHSHLFHTEAQELQWTEDSGAFEKLWCWLR
jgi:hypothetical protein